MANIERISSRIIYKAKKWEFIHKKDYDESETQYPVREGKSYIISYDTDKKEMYLDGKNNVLTRLKNHTLFNKYSKTNVNLRREIYLKPHKLVLTKKIKKRGMVTRYFAQYKFDKDDRIFEISKRSFSQKTKFYEKVALMWQLEGSKENIRMRNEEEISVAEDSLHGIQNLLDPLELYEEDITLVENLQKKLSRLKFIPDSTDTSSDPPPGWSAGDGPPPGSGY